MSVIAALQAALAAEHQVVYGYGLAGARLGADDRRRALRRLDVHRARRDTLARLIRATGADPDVGAPAYLPPFPVTGVASALRLAEHLEVGAAGAAWDLAAATTASTDARRLAVTALADTARAAAYWRHRAGSAVDPALPGQPG